jgi:FkbM family methyltransferase
MHNGLKVHKVGYADGNISSLIWLLKGVHEPQEEKCFFECLKFIKPGGTMIELGANWAFYSMWFAKDIPNAKCHCIEADVGALELGIKHFELNGLKATFTNGQFGRPDLKPWSTDIVGRYIRTTPDGHIWWRRTAPKPGLHRNIPLLTVDQFVHDNEIDFVDLLHSDIQNQEFLMLQGAEKTFSESKVGFIFISTHSDEVHQSCKSWLDDKGYVVIAEHSMQDSFSGDGLLVAKGQKQDGPEHIAVSKRSEICPI